jgi:RNA polymerase sigma-70 factor (ECF subfamily)
LGLQLKRPFDLLLYLVLNILSHIKNYHNDSDPELISLWKEGDEKAFECLYKRYVVYLTNIATKKTTSIDIAKDCVQEVFLSVYHRKDELQTTTSLKSYLYTALQHKIYNHYQKVLTRIKYEQAASVNLKIVGNNLNEEFESKDLEKQIQEKILSLPPQCRKVFLLSREEQLPYKEIAKQLNISVNTVDQHIQKALRILKNTVGRMAHLFFW